jgi:dienelactone hydrolase
VASFGRNLLIGLLSLSCAMPAIAAGPTETITVTGRRPSSTPLWFEQAYDDYPDLGPEFAKGLVIWNHPIDWNGLGPDVPPIRAIQGLAALGWDVVRLQRNSRIAEAAQWQAQIQPLLQSLAQEVADAKSRGYKRVIIAGQGFGGGIAIESAMAIKDLYGVIAFAPNTGVGRGRTDQGNMTTDISGDLVSINEKWTASRLKQIAPVRLFVVFPEADEQMLGHERGADARALLAARGDLSFVLVDENHGIRGNAGADNRRFDPYATCLDYFLEPDRTLPAGEFHCGADETRAALTQMGVKPGAGGGQAWFGYSTRGQETYLELLPGGKVIYGWGHGPLGKTAPGVKTYDAKFEGDAFSFTLPDFLMVRGVRRGEAMRVTIELPDRTRAAADMHPI